MEPHAANDMADMFTVFVLSMVMTSILATPAIIAMSHALATRQRQADFDDTVNCWWLQPFQFQTWFGRGKL